VLGIDDGAHCFRELSFFGWCLGCLRGLLSEVIGFSGSSSGVANPTGGTIGPSARLLRVFLWRLGIMLQLSFAVPVDAADQVPLSAIAAQVDAGGVFHRGPIV
jgi:hypothetical protein